ncbi:hypothetical protein [Dactylococcopsis salina]|nr:hypothetical protein [Dactylococcopsis salina]
MPIFLFSLYSFLNDWSLVTGHWSLVTGHWSLVTDYCSSRGVVVILME